MASERETMFRQMVKDYPDAAMGWFSLGKLLLEERRAPEAAEALRQAVTVDPDYAAAWVALGDAMTASSNKEGARDAWQRALATPLGQRDLSLQGDLEDRLRALDEF